MKRTPNTIDAMVGEKIRFRRRALGMTQSVMADKLGISFQQFQKYEKGKNRIGASRLIIVAKTLNVSIGFFFDDLPPEAVDPVNTDLETRTLVSFALTGEGLALNSAFMQIDSPHVRKRLVRLVSALADEKA